MPSQIATSKPESVYEELWSNKDVRSLHIRFDAELAKVKSQEEFTSLMGRFFGPAGLLEEGLDVWRGADVPEEDVIRAASEFFQLKFLIQCDFFLNGYPEDVVEKWWKARGPKPFNQEESYSSESVKKLFHRFNEDVSDAKHLSDLEQIGALYLSPTGVLAREFAKAEALEESEQIQTCAELFQLRGHIEGTMFIFDFSVKSERWTVPFVRGLVYAFERELKGAEDKRALQKLKGLFLGKDGLVGQACMRAGQEKNAVAEEQLNLFSSSLKEFFQGEAD